MSSIYLVCQKQTRHKCPLYKYVFCSFSNIINSWCQYEALKYVSFPHQVLAKAAKTIPAMIMGKIVSKTKYKYYEYVTSIILSVGMLMFMLDVGNDSASSAITTLSGAILLTFYIIFDSFTSNWQGALFKTYSVGKTCTNDVFCQFIFLYFYSRVAITTRSFLKFCSFYV
jgi:adenosine 3'-phospho 5'-phosphosulfate transporter B2